MRPCATLDYDDARRLEQVDYSSGAREIRVYDDADRLTEVRHEDATEDALHKTTYVWTINNWVAERAEVDYTVTPSTSTVVEFEYDNRGRLIEETRVVDETTTVYDLSYTYDQLGNRQTKVDAVSDQWVIYDYDVDLEDPNDLDFPTWHNRLLEYRIYDGDPNGQGTELLRTVSYTYYKTGQASNITVKDEGEGAAYDVYHDLALYYHSHGPLWRALWGSYTLDQYGDPTGYETSGAREFFYDSPRARYLATDYDTNASENPAAWDRIEPALWTDYAGVLPYRDREFADDDFTDVLHYLGTAARQTVSTSDTAFQHGDLIGSANLTTDDDGDANQTPAVAYTAFGEVIGDASTLSTRYQYGGRHGYESDLLALEGVSPNLPDITLQHVGARWYQPDLGRFVQRDPVGIAGGLNVYAYCRNRALDLVDPAGLFSSLSHPKAAAVFAELAALGYSMQRGGHAAQRMAERFVDKGRDPQLIVTCFTHGRRFWDALNRAIVHINGKVQVAVTPGGTIKTVNWVGSGRVPGRLRPLDPGFPTELVMP